MWKLPHQTVSHSNETASPPSSLTSIPTTSLRSASPRHWASAPRTPNRARTLQPFPPLSHSGPGLTLVRSALDDVRSQGGIKVVSICPFVKAWMLKNPKYPDLLYGT